MLPRSSWLNILIILLVIIAGSYVAQMAWGLLVQFSDVLLLFVLAWLVSFALGPLVERINAKPLPPEFVQLAGRSFGPRAQKNAERFRFTRVQAVGIVYLGLTLALVFVIAALVPPTLVQINTLVAQFPEYGKNVVAWSNEAQRIATDMGLRNIDVAAALTSALSGAQTLASTILANAVVIFASVLSLLANVLFVLILSFFFALDGPRLFRALFNLIPETFDDEVIMLSVTVDRTFGGFIRAQLLQALLISIGTLIVTTLFAQPFVLVASLFAGLFMLIPFVGAALALIPPLLTTLMHDPRQLPFALGILLVYQLLIVNVIVPKILSDALGLHPLVIIASLLIGIKLGGFWGAFFGVPVAGVIATMAIFFYRRRLLRQQRAEQAAAAKANPAAVAAGPPVSPPPAPSSTAPPAPARDLEKKQVS